MRKSLILTVMLLVTGFTRAQTIVRDPEQRKDFANVYWSRQYTLFDLVTDEPIYPLRGKGIHIYKIYYSSNEDPRPHFGRFTAEELEKHLFYKFKNRKNCMQFCKSKVRRR